MPAHNGKQWQSVQSKGQLAAGHINIACRNQATQSRVLLYILASMSGAMAFAQAAICGRTVAAKQCHVTHAEKWLEHLCSGYPDVVCGHSSNSWFLPATNDHIELHVHEAV